MELRCSYKQAESLLQTYSFEELLELNGLTEEEVLQFLIEEDFLDLPDPKPIDYDEE